jgi:hypothetical protein
VLSLPDLEQRRGISLPIFVLVDGLVATRANQQKITNLIQSARIMRELSATARPIRGKRIDVGFLRDVNPLPGDERLVEETIAAAKLAPATGTNPQLAFVGARNTSGNFFEHGGRQEWRERSLAPHPCGVSWLG